MKKINLCFFDFDGTLVHTPLPDTGKDEWSSLHNKPYPHLGWWSKPESLDAKLSMALDEVVAKEHANRMSASDTVVYLLTSRLQKLQSHVISICDKYGLKFHKLQFRDFELDKGDIVLREIRQHIADGFTVGKVEVWDDRIAEHERFEAIEKEVLSMCEEYHIHKTGNNDF
jgi:hypothetical protein